ncbi:MAG: hypothetical protein J1F65_04005 [Clostridiales bacterium]|nr:hypothetical protein [Clostridiales bacterium]
MSNIKRVAILIVVVALVALVGESFNGSNILDRAIVLGIGIDATEDGLELTAEVVSPGNGTEQVGTFSKTVSVTARAIGEAMQRVAEKTGKEASLGQCVVLILGQDYYEQKDFSDTIEYFIKHDSFKESAVICCCEGTAKDLLNRGDALSQSVSLSVATALLDEAENVAIYTNNLLDFARSQSELHCTGFLNKVKFVPSENKDAQDPDKMQGFFSYSEMAIFRKNSYVCALNEEEVMGMALFFKDVTGDTYVCDDDGLLKTLKVNDKQIEQKLTDDGGMEINITLSVRFGRTDSEEVSGAITAKKDKEIAQKLLDDVQKQATELANKFLAKQAEYNFDLIKLHESYRRKQGTSSELANKPTADFPIKLTLKVEEN